MGEYPGTGLVLHVTEVFTSFASLVIWGTGDGMVEECTRIYSMYSRQRLLRLWAGNASPRAVRTALHASWKISISRKILFHVLRSSP